MSCLLLLLQLWSFLSALVVPGWCEQPENHCLLFSTGIKQELVVPYGGPLDDIW